MAEMREHTVEYESYMIELAERNIARGVIEEPRIFFERLFIPQDATDPILADPNTFVNGEKFPVRILYMTASTFAETTEPAFGVLGERLIQRVGMHMRFHDQFYMNTEFPPLSVWGTQVVASSDVVNISTSAHKTWRPLVLSARDTLEITVKLAIPTLSVPAPFPVTVTCTGVGIFSKRPYFLSSTVFIADGSTQQLPLEAFRNEGSEPILLTDITHNAAGDGDPSSLLDARFVDVGVKQIGNGTNADWVVGAPGSLNMASMSNWGSYSGRAMVHRFPGQGLIWEPSEGIEVALKPLRDVGRDGVFVNVALLGYIAIQ